MPDDPMTVRRFFFGRREGAGRFGRQLDRQGQLDELQQALGEQLGKSRWKLVAREIGKQIAAVLDFSVAEKVLAPAWQRLELLQEYRDPEAHPPEESALVPLFEHSIRSNHEPHIDLMLKDVEIGRLALTVELALDLEGVLLRIQDARIRGIEDGSAKGSGRLSCSFGGRQIYSLERESRTFRLETGIAFAKGIPIPALDVEATPPPEAEP